MEYLLVSPQNPWTSHPFEKGLQIGRQRTYFPSMGKGFVFDLMRFRASNLVCRKARSTFWWSLLVSTLIFLPLPLVPHIALLLGTALPESQRWWICTNDVWSPLWEGSDSWPSCRGWACGLIFLWLHVVFSYHSSGESLHSKVSASAASKHPAPACAAFPTWSF